MKTRLIFIFTVVVIALAALSAEALIEKDSQIGMHPKAEISEESVKAVLKAKYPPYLEFSKPEEALTYMKESKNWDDYKRGILPRMANEQLDYALRLLNSSYDGFVVVDKSRMKVMKFNKFGVEEVSFGMACGKNFGTKHEKADCRTPEGFFSVRKIQNSTDWHYVDDNGHISPKTGEFGPRFIRLRIPGTSQIGIHGTSAPWSIGGRRSHGCIRLTNENIMRLVEMVDSGMPVIVSPSKQDMEVNEEEGYKIPKISTFPDKEYMNI